VLGEDESKGRERCLQLTRSPISRRKVGGKGKLMRGKASPRKNNSQRLGCNCREILQLLKSSFAGVFIMWDGSRWGAKRKEARMCDCGQRSGNGSPVNQSLQDLRLEEEGA